MQAGKLRHRITIQMRAQTQDPVTGESTFDWVDFGTVWAAFEPLSARDFIAAQATQNEIKARVKMRFLSGVDDTMRLIHAGEVYNIEGVLPDAESGRRYLTLPVSSGASDGR